MTANNNLTTNFNVDPYYDDYDETKNFHRILYRPGFAVQARELTQQQSILQNQIHRFGNHIFKDGSEVTGTSEVLDQLNVFRLKSTYAGSAIDVTAFENNYARTRTSNKLFKVKKVIPAAGGDFDLIYVQYIQEANTSANVVASSIEVSNNEIVDFSTSYINTTTKQFTSNTGAAQILATGDTTVAKLPVTRGFLYSVDESVYYHKGLFIRAPKQTLAVAANVNHTMSIGFTSTETLVSSDDDTTLTDPARGSYNYAAPGADRLKVELTLTAKPVADISSAPVSSNNYFEVARVQNGNFIRRRPSADYNILADELARRTFEESGNYTVDGLQLNIGNTSATTSNLVAIFSPGTAYVKGYRIRSDGSRQISFPKGRATDSITEQNITALYGNYLIANTVTTGLMDIDDRVELHSNLTPSAATKVGEAHIRNIEYLSGSGTGRKYKVFLYDIRITDATKNFNSVKSIIRGTHSSYTAYVEVNTDSITSFNKTGTLVSGSAEVRLTSAGGVKVGQLIEGGGIEANTKVNSILFDTITMSRNATISQNNATLTFSSLDLTDKEFNKSYFVMPHINVANVVNVDYKFKRKFASVSFINGSATIQTLSGSERFSSGTGDLANENFIVVVKTGGAGTITTGENVDLTAGSRSVTVPTPTPGNPGSATINVDEASFNGTADIIAAIDVTADSRRVKTRNSSQTKTFAGGYPTNGTKLSIGYADVIKINAIYEGNSSLVTSNTSQAVRVYGVDTTMQDVTSKFIFNNGQRESFYDHGTIELKPGYGANTNQILVDFDYFSHGGGLGYFSDKSYPSYASIPSYINTKGEEIFLRDTLDFRPTRSSNTSSNTYISTKAFENHQIVDSQTFEIESDYSYYKRVVHKISLDHKGNFVVTSGAAALNNPPIPQTSEDTMLLATLFVNPYTYDERDLRVKLEDNRRYTMRDIGGLENRIENLEYYTSLNLLETQVASTQFLDDNGEARYKNGFIVDPFQGHSVGDVFDSNYKASIDRAQQIMRPKFTSDQAPLVAGTSGLTINNKIVTLPYTEVAYVDQTTASGTINVNPFQVVSFVGNAILDPTKDTWVDNVHQPSVVTNDEGHLDHYEKIVKYIKETGGYEYGDWRRNSETKITALGGIQEVGVKERTNVRLSLDLNSTTYYPYMRSRKVNFELTALRPNTKLYVFMDGVDISDHAAPNSYSSTKPEQVLYDSTPDQIEIVTDEFGAASGYFWIPNGKQTLSRAAYLADPNAQVASDLSNASNDPRDIKTGTVDVLFVDNFINPQFARTSAAATFTAAGTRNEYELVRTPEIERRPINRRGFFLSSWHTEQQAYDATGASAADIAVARNYIEATYVNYIRRRPEYAGYVYWLSQWINGAFASTSDLVASIQYAADINALTLPCKYGRDPLAQTFFIPAEFYPNGIFVSSADIFMASKDSNLPLSVELRPTVNGFPSSEDVIPNSRVTLNPSQINANASTPTATNVPFRAPIHLLPGEYSIVLLTDSLEYNTYIATIGEDRLDGTGVVATQPTLGSLFKSQNARTWTPQQESDLCFKLYQAQFTTGTSFSIEMSSNNIGRVAYSANTSYANTVGEYDVANIVMPKYDTLSVFNTTYEMKTKNAGGSVLPYSAVLPNQDLVFANSKEITTNSDLQVKVTFETSDTNVSPYFDLGSTAVSLVKNIINAPPTGTYVAETAASDSYALAKYITRKVTLADGLSAKSLKVFVDQNMPAGATVEVYYRVINIEDETDFADRPYVQMSRRQPSVTVNQDYTKYNEYEYYADNITYSQAGVAYDQFDAFSIKIVMYSTSSAAAPTFRNFRAIALA